ncbi:menaquinone-dependent protoporphyrinogen IX dehydrogenase [Endothiovibrio diazotrophicus]
MGGVLLLYSTVDGHTLTICRRLAAVIEAGGQLVTLHSFDDGEPPDAAGFAKIVVGASIRYGKHRPNVAQWVEANRRLLDERPSAFFSVCLAARKPNRNRPDTNPYLKKFLRRTAWHPRESAVFAGRLDYPRCGFFDRQMIRLIMWLTHGPTDPRGVHEFTDWAAVEAFGRRVAEM